MMKFPGKRFPWCLVVLLLPAMAGCNDGPKTVEVVGVLTYKGKPVTNAYIDFVPEHGRPSWAQTDEQGRFKLNYTRGQDGIIAGEHKVAVRMRPATAEDQEAIMMGRKPRISKELEEFFNKYSATSSTKVVRIEPNTRELKLDWD